MRPVITRSRFHLSALALLAATLLAQGCSLTSGTLIPASPTSEPSPQERGVRSTRLPIVPEINKDSPPQPTLKPMSTGKASWYGPGFRGKKTASGEIFDDAKFTAAHKSLPFGSKAKVTNLNNGKSVKVEINDRGPYVQDRVIDLSQAAAHALGIIDLGVARVRVDLIIEENGVASSLD